MGESPFGEASVPPAGTAAAQRALIELAEAAGAGASLPEVLERVARAAATLVTDALVHVWIASEDERELRLTAEIGGRPDRGRVELRRVLPLGEGLLGAVVRSAEPVVVPSLEEDPRPMNPGWLRDQGIASFAGVRLARGARPLGALCLLTWRPHVFSPLEVDFLRSFGAHAAIAIEGAALLEAAAERLRRLEALASVRAERVKVAAQVGQLLASTRDSDRMVDLVAAKCREVLGAEAFGLFRLERDELHYVRGFGLEEPFHQIALGEGLVGRAALDRRTMETADVLRDPNVELSSATRARIERLGLRAVAAVPLLATDRVLGVLAIYHPTGFRLPTEDREFLETLAAHTAVALENARLFAETRRRQEEAEALAAITRTLTASLDLRTVLARVAAGIRELFGAEGGAIGLLTKRGSMRLAARVGLGADTLRQLVVAPGKGGTGWVLRHGQLFHTTDYTHDPRITETLIPEIGQAGIVGMLAVPVRLQEELVGILYGFWSQPVPLSSEHLSLATDLAGVVAVAVANARLYQEARDREAEARALFEVGRLISSSLDPDRVFDRIVERVLELTNVRACGIFRVDPDGLLRYARGSGLSAEFMRDLAVPLGEGTSGQSVAERRPVWAADLAEAETRVRSIAMQQLVEREGYRAVLSVPILTQGAPFGCLATYWWERHEPTPAEVQTLTSLATLAAVAIENARLYDATRRQVERLERLSLVNRAVSASLRLDDVLDEIARAAGVLYDAPLTTVWLADEAERVLVRRALHGAPEIRAQLPERLAFGQGGVGVVAERRRAQLNIPVEGNIQIVARDVLLRHGVRTFTGLPVMLGDRLLGVLAVSSRGGRSLDAADEALLQALVGQAAVAIQNARLYEEARAHEIEARRALEELRRTQEQLVRMEKLRALGEMASGVAHDFNNVLAVILGRVQLLQRKLEDPTFRRWLDIVEQAALDGAQTVRQIQEFTRVRRDQPTQTVDLNQTVRDAVAMTRARWRDEPSSRGIEVRLALDLGIIPLVDGQPPELREVLTNLIVNAVEALPMGGDIRISTRLREDRVEVIVADTGVGMSDSVRRRIFEPFFSTKRPSGPGLGLAMVYGIVSRHGGEILVDTEEGAGSTVTIRLPVGTRKMASRSAGPHVGADSVRILVIDDEPFVRETLEEILRQQHHDVVAVDDGLAGLAQFRASAFDLVMTDLAMPGMSGWQVAKAVKAMRPDVPVVLVTGWGVEVDVDELQAHGVDRVMTKPFRYEDVQEVVASFRGTGGLAGPPSWKGATS